MNKKKKKNLKKKKKKLKKKKKKRKKKKKNKKKKKKKKNQKKKKKKKKIFYKSLIFTWNVCKKILTKKIFFYKGDPPKKWEFFKKNFFAFVNFKNIHFVKIS